MTREGVRKGPAAEAEKDASQHAVGGIARVSFFLFIFIHIQFKYFFYFCVSTSGLNTTRPTKRNDVEAGKNYKREGKQEARATERGGNKSKDHEKTISKTRTNRKIPPNRKAQFFPFWERPGRRLLSYFCSEKRPEYVANAGGAISELFYSPPRGAFTPFFTVFTL